LIPIRPARRARQGQPARRSGLFWSAAIVLTLWVAAGGGIINSGYFWVLALSGSWLFAYLIAEGGLAAWRDLPRPAQVAIGFFCVLPLLQCVPLPPSLWHALPGRELAREALALTGDADRWHPLTLTFTATFRSWLVAMWLLALLLSAVRLRLDELVELFRLLVALGAAHLLLGVAQLATGGGLQLHDSSNPDTLLGFFVNKNHSGLFIALLFPLAWAALHGERGWDRSRLGWIVTGTLVMFAALVLTFSRAALGLGALAFCWTLFLVNERRVGSAGRLTVATVLVLGAAVTVIASTDIAARSIGRFSGVGTDPRWLFWSWSRQLVPVYFPAGSGIGSFPDVFRVAERLAWVKPTYLNHAHNEYLEQLIEVGAAAPLLWAAVAAMLVGPLRRAWQGRDRTAGRLALAGGTVVLLVLLHSGFDYPLRRPALAAVFVVALGALLRRQKPIA
jgi:O-antigen ligase